MPLSSATGRLGDSRSQEANGFCPTPAPLVEGAVPDIDTQARFGRTLLGVDTALQIEKWVEDNVAAMSIALDEVEMLDLMWPLLTRLAPEERLRDTTPPESLKQLALGWIGGKPFRDLCAALDAAGARYPHGKQERKFTIDMVVELLAVAAHIARAGVDAVRGEERADDGARQCVRSRAAELGDVRVRVTVPVASASTVSPSPVPCAGRIARARPSSAICANLFACALVSRAFVSRSRRSSRGAARRDPLVDTSWAGFKEGAE